MKNLSILPTPSFVPPEEGSKPSKKYFLIQTDIGQLAMYVRPQLALYLCHCLCDCHVPAKLIPMEASDLVYFSEEWIVRIINPETEAIFIEVFMGDNFSARTIAALFSLQFKRHLVRMCDRKTTHAIYANGIQLNF